MPSHERYVGGMSPTPETALTEPLQPLSSLRFLPVLPLLRATLNPKVLGLIPSGALAGSPVIARLS